MTAVDPEAEAAARALSLRLFRGMVATQESFAAYLGVRLGLYEALRDHGPLTAAELSERAGVAARYAREWLEQQAVCGMLRVAGLGRYELPPGHERVLVASDDPLSTVSTGVLPLGGVAAALPSLLAAYRSGDGVAADVFGDDWRDGHNGANRALYTHQLAGWVRRYLPDVHERLGRPGARIADLGCGAGWAAIALARAYPAVCVTAVDLDEPSVARAREHVAEAGLADRIECRHADLAEAGSADYDLVCLFDAVHELPRPVEALRACRRQTTPGGVVLILDAQVAADFAAPGNEVERFQYATSVLHCLPAGLVGEGAGGTGTVLREATLRAYAVAAGLPDVRAYDLPDRLHRLYRLSTLSD